MAEPRNNKHAPKVINPNSRLKKVGTRTDAIQRRSVDNRRQVAPYPCPICKRRMYADEVIDFGTVTVGTAMVKHTGKYHRDCMKES